MSSIGNVYVYNATKQDVHFIVNGGEHILPAGQGVYQQEGNFMKFTPSESVIPRNGTPTGNEGKFKSDNDDNCTTELLIQTDGQENGPYQVVIKPSQYSLERNLQMSVYYTGAVLSYEGKVIWESIEAVD